MAEETRRGGDGTHFAPYGPGVPPPSPNGSGKRRARPRAGTLRGVVVGLLVTGMLATSVVPRLHLLNLAFYNPWRRPVVVSGIGGIAAGAARRGRPVGAALAGALAAVLAVWVVYGMTRAQIQVLFVEREPLRVVLADLGRLAAYAAPAGALGALAGWGLRVLGTVLRDRRTHPITSL